VEFFFGIKIKYNKKARRGKGTNPAGQTGGNLCEL
jgi:hypothetical protein